MADFSCDIKSPCLDPASPFINTTAEAPDRFEFLARNTGFGPSYPPLGQNWTQLGCTVYCTSTESQEDADQCAALNWLQCISDKWPPLPPLPPILNRFGQPVPNPLPRPIYLSAPQQVTVNCPDGLPFVYTLPAGKFGGFSQAMADAAALSYAQQHAADSLICLGDVTPNVCCSAITYAGTITASGARLTAQNACWEIFGSLPPGMDSELDGAISCVIGTLTLHFGGTPDTPGVYNFAVKVSDDLGNYMLKPVTITVSGITNTGFPDGVPGTDYGFQNVTSAGVTNPIYSIESGALPDGLLLDSGGIIYGTPTTGGDFAFQLGVTEAGTGRTCYENFSITIVSGFIWDLVWNDPPTRVFSEGGGTYAYSFASNGFNITTTSPGDDLSNADVQNWGQMSYTGPDANANVRLTFITTASSVDYVRASLYQDGNPIFDQTWLPPANGIVNIPCVISAGVGSVLQMFIEVLSGQDLVVSNNQVIALLT